MKLLLISFGDIEYDGRLRRLVSVFNQIGELYVFTRGKQRLTQNGKICNTSYFFFIINAIHYARELGSADVLIIDSRKATIPGLLLKAMNYSDYIIQDCRELYLFDEVKLLRAKIGCIFEKSLARKADIVICASHERAEIMKNRLSLFKLPLVYSNIRKLEYANVEEKEKARLKFAPMLKENEIRIISLAGCNIHRTTDVLVKNLKNVRQKCRLFLAGSNIPDEEKIIRDLAALDTRNEVIILGQLNHGELKYLVQMCHIGIVNYSQDDSNNKFCASGKLFEYLFEGIPVVTTTNPPLKRFCEEEKVGVADDSFAGGINKVLENYAEYKERVKDFTKRVTVADNDRLLINEIEKKLRKE